MATIRKDPLVTEKVYHVYNKSIAKYKIFNNDNEFLRMKNLFRYYQWENINFRFSKWNELKNKDDFFNKAISKCDKLIEITAYCIMPTHIHLVLKQLKDKGISVFMAQISNSYARYFNLKHKRKGPLWEREFQNVLVSTDEEFLHLSRYVHLNPTTSYLVDRPEDWPFSSYNEYLEKTGEEERICNFRDLLDCDVKSYKNFAEDRISYQRELGKIKHLLLE